ncbi:hypothetical protein ACRAQ7_13885 [Erythrobacter sp. W53]|uniref:hypothetical protein n=1 Tax=Erythrobacter sp. W53 TaxID=3425947 RepID=UPI003D769F12
MMLKRLLACFALMTGLAAVSAPAQANLTAAFGTQLESTQKHQDTKKQRRGDCQHDKRKKRELGAPTRPCAEANPIRIFLPTVQLRIDLALE